MSDPRPTTEGGRRFHLRGMLGSGAFGEVYLADMDSGNGFRRRVALKLLREDLSRNTSAAMRMRDEARILGHLSHRHIVSVVDLVEIGSRWAVVMDYVPGADLEELIGWTIARGVEPPIPAALELMAAVASALHSAWNAADGDGNPMRVVHRDIKPSNLRVTADGDVKVLDFGVARVDLADREAATRGAGWIGTERYMAPERILLEGDTPAGDVYALAASVIEFLNGEALGRTPVLEERHGPFVEAAVARVGIGLPDALRDALRDLLRAGLHADPLKRPTASELSERAESLARRVPGESLRAFASRAVPEILQANLIRPVDGVLSEGLPGTGPPREAPSMAGWTTDIAFVDDDRPPVELTTLHDAEAPRARWLPAAALAGMGAGGVVTFAFGLVLVIGLASWMPTRTPAPEPRPDAVAASEPRPDAVVASEPRPDAVVAPEPRPDAVVASEPVPAPSVGPANPGPVVRPRPTPVSAPEPAPVAPPASVVRVRQAKFSFDEGVGITARCGDRSAEGTRSVVLRDFPAGRCAIDGRMHDGRALQASADVQREATIACTSSDGGFACAVR